MTRAELRDEVRFNLKRSSDALPDTRINTWLNWALQFVADLHTYEEMRVNETDTTPSDGTNTMNFPSNMKDLYSVRVQDGASSVKLEYVFPRLFDRIVPYPSASSRARPGYYVDYGTQYELFPIPDKEYPLLIRCSVYPSPMTSDNDTPSLLRKDALLVAVATVFGFWSLREVEDAAYWGKEIVPQLFKASVASDHSGEDWTPIARPFRVRTSSLVGEWWKNPFTGRTL